MIAITSCWHLQGDRLEDRLYWIDQALSQMRKQGVRAILHCGDLFHYARIGTKEAPAPVIIEGLKKVLAHYRIPVFLAAGNHDQVEGHDCSAVHAMDGFPYLAYMGDVGSFDLPIAGYEDVGFVAQDWLPRGSDADWGVGLSCRVGACGKKQVVVFGHAVLPDVSGLDLPNANWPRPRKKHLEVMAEVAEVDRVACFFGHNHAGSQTQVFERGTFRGVPALARLRWDEAAHEDGWFLLHPDLRVTHYLLEGPRFVDLTKTPENGWAMLPRMSRVRLSVRDSRDVDAVRMAREAGTKVEVVPDEVEERQRSEASTTTVRMGMTPRTAFIAWCYDQQEADVEACAELERLLADKELPRMRLEGVAQVSAVCLQNHLAFPGARRNWSFALDRWSCLVGATGSGKSSLLEAVYAALYGVWPSPHRRGSFWAAFAGENGGVEAHVQLNGGSVLEVVRRREDGTPFLTADLNETPLTKYSQPKKVQPAIDPLVDDPDLWLRSSFLTQDHSPDLVESPPEERLKAFNRVLGIEEIAAVRAVVADEIKALLPVEKQYQAECAEAEELTSGLADDEKQEFQLRARLRTEEAMAKAARAQADAVGEAYRKSHLVEERQHLEVVIAGAPSHEDVLALQRATQKASFEVEKARNRLRERENTERVYTMGQEAEADLKCVGCYPDLLPCRLIDVAKNRKDAADSLGEIGPGDPYRSHLKETQERHADVRQRTTQLEGAYQAAQRSRARLEALGPSDAGETLVTADEYAIVRHAADQLEAEVRHVEKELTYLTAQMELRRRRRDEMVGYAAQKVERLRRLPDLKLLERAFARDGIQRSLVEQGLPAIQAELDSLTSADGLGDLRIHIDYAASDPKAVPTVLVSVQGGPWLEAKPRSGGQRAIVRLLVRLACCLWIAKTTGKRSVLILDEPTAGVSEAYADSLARLLVSLVGPDLPFAQGVLATHDEGFAQLVGNARRVDL